MKVKDVMTRGVVCTRPEETLRVAGTKMRDLDVGTLPVCGENDRLVGMVTDRDIVVRSVAAGLDPATTRVSDIMTANVVYCYDDDDTKVAARLMKDKQIRRLVILNHDKRLSGIMSLGDLAVRTGDDELAGDALEHISAH